MFKILGIIGLIAIQDLSYAADAFDCNYTLLRMGTSTYSGKILEHIPSTVDMIKENLDFLSPNPEGRIKYRPDNLKASFTKLCERSKNIDLNNQTLIEFVGFCEQIFNEESANVTKIRPSIYMLLKEVSISLRK